MNSFQNLSPLAITIQKATTFETIISIVVKNALQNQTLITTLIKVWN